MGVSYSFYEFIADIEIHVAQRLPEAELTTRVADNLQRLLADGLQLSDTQIAPDAHHYVMRPLYVAPDKSFSIAAAVWNVGQSTPVHGHETWGVVGIHSGVEHETRYAKPSQPDEPLIELDSHSWKAGQVAVCCTTDDDVHAVTCGSDVPCVGIHVYGADIGTLRRRSYEPATGAQSWFVSKWA
jgi:3-mercaptopropionate dioxygenase